MGLLDSAREAADAAPDDDGTDDYDGPRARTATVTQQRQGTVTVAGEELDLAEIETTQPDENGTWLTGANSYGRPRGADALQHRQIVQTSAMQAIVNGVAQNIIGGDLTFNSDESVMDGLGDAEQQRAEQLRELLRDVLTGPHLQRESLDDLVVAAVEDMMGPGEAVWQLIGAANDDLPVAALTTLDPLTVRKNVDKHGVFRDPPYWQTHSAFSSESVASLSQVSPVALQQDDVAVLRYPYGNRSYEGAYPISPAWQVREWLEILANSTTHHNRFYNDDEIPSGIISLIENATGNTVDDLKERIERAAGDPRDVPVVEGSAQWIEMGGTAVNLNIIEEQRWFFFLCLGSLGLGKQDLGFVEDVNRSNGEVESTRVYKQVTGPFIKHFEEAFLKVARQFEAFTDLGEPFTPTLSFSDPREERAKEQRLREMYQAGGLTLRQYVRRRGDTDLAEDDDRYTVELAGETVDYGDHPRWVAQALLSAAAGDGVDVDGMPDDSPDDDSEGEQPGQQAVVNGHGGA